MNSDRADVVGAFAPDRSSITCAASKRRARLLNIKNQSKKRHAQEQIVTQKRVEFFWDPASPYTYLAATQIDALAERCDVEILWKPFVLGKVFEATGNAAPARIPAKGKQLFHDVQRWARYYGVGFAMPKVFPVHSIAALRAGCAANLLGKGGAFAQAIMHTYWVLGRDISQPDAIAEAAARAGLDGATLLAQTQLQEIKDQLRVNTDDAIARGAFGAPTFFCGEHMFWGNDRLILLEAFLTGKLAA
jgi:2-hydroxychromene-2-carboxylate isomerase